MRYSEWEERRARSRRLDPLWRMRAYRLASYLGDECWQDAVALERRKITVGVSEQLYRSVGSISSNLSEGYSRSSGRDRARIFEYALGSARESREWYWRGEPVLGDPLVYSRLEILDEIVRLMVATIPRERDISIERLRS